MEVPILLLRALWIVLKGRMFLLLPSMRMTMRHLNLACAIGVRLLGLESVLMVVWNLGMNRLVGFLTRLLPTFDWLPENSFVSLLTDLLVVMWWRSRLVLVSVVLLLLLENGTRTRCVMTCVGRCGGSVRQCLWVTRATLVLVRVLCWWVLP